MRSASSHGRRAGAAMRFRPVSQAPVSERGCATISAGVPAATTSPPCTPAPGPMSITQSARRIVASSCSTTTTVFRASRRRSKLSSRREWSRGWSPIEGSSRM